MAEIVTNTSECLEVSIGHIVFRLDENCHIDTLVPGEQIIIMSHAFGLEEIRDNINKDNIFVYAGSKENTGDYLWNTLIRLKDHKQMIFWLPINDPADLIFRRVFP